MKPRILFVCHGNICRSPTGEAILQKLEPNWIVDSAGTHAELGYQNAHPKTIRVAKHYGVEINHTPRQFEYEDFTRFDFIVTADTQVHSEVIRYAKTDEERDKVVQLARFSTKGITEIPDPYYELNFEEVFEYIKDCCEQFQLNIKEKEKRMYSS